MITLITATGGRPDSLAHCEKLMSSQTYKGPVQWIVVDDCSPYTAVTKGQTYLRGPKPWKPGFNTQRLNLDLAISKANGEYIFIIEDDDYYAPNYLDVHIAFLKIVDLVGEARSRYFNVAVPGYKIMPNTKHASLAQTAFHRKLLPMFEQSVNSGEFYIDIDFWRRVNASDFDFPSLLATNGNLCIGIKGMPGRDGISPGHKSKDFMYDPDFKKLREWIGNDADYYLKFKKGR